MNLLRRALERFCCILICVELCCATPPLAHRAKYSNSLHLAMSTRARVQQLLETYKEELLGVKNFEERGGQLEGLPLLSTDFNSWLNVTDWERLHAAFWDIHAYRNMLQRKRNQLERVEKGQVATQNDVALPQTVKNIELDLRDLMRHVRSQMHLLKGPGITPAMPTERTEPRGVDAQFQSHMVWDSRVEGYIILRDLNLYLIKLARDFLLLASHTH